MLEGKRACGLCGSVAVGLLGMWDIPSGAGPYRLGAWDRAQSHARPKLSTVQAARQGQETTETRNVLFQASLTCLSSPECQAPMVYLDCNNASVGEQGSECLRSCHTLDVECVSPLGATPTFITILSYRKTVCVCGGISLKGQWLWVLASSWACKGQASPCLLSWAPE